MGASSGDGARLGTGHVPASPNVPRPVFRNRAFACSDCAPRAQDGDGGSFGRAGLRKRPEVWHVRESIVSVASTLIGSNASVEL